MTNSVKTTKKGFLNQICSWLNKFTASDIKIYSDRESQTKAELIKKIREKISQDYQEMLWLDSYTEKHLKFKSIDELRSLLARLEKPKTKEPD